MAQKKGIDLEKLGDPELIEVIKGLRGGEQYDPLTEFAFLTGTIWKGDHLWRDAEGDYLPQIDREVIALTGGEDGFYKVVFAHRPVPDGHAITYGKGGWNIPDVKYWLDADLPQ